MKTILQHAQGLVYSLLYLMPSVYQKASLQAIFALFLDQQGHALPEHTPVKSASSLSRFLNHYNWPTRQVIRTTRQTVLEQLSAHPPHHSVPVRVLIDLTTLPKTGHFKQLSSPTDDPEVVDPWVRMLNGKRGLHLVVLYLVVGDWRVPWSFRVWRGKGQLSPAQLACQLLGTIPKSLVGNRTVIVLHCFGQSTQLGVFRCLLLSLIAYLLTHWIHCWSRSPALHWKETSRLALETLLPSVLRLQLLMFIQYREEIAALHGFQISLKPLSR